MPDRYVVQRSPNPNWSYMSEPDPHLCNVDLQPCTRVKYTIYQCCGSCLLLWSLSRSYFPLWCESGSGSKLPYKRLKTLKKCTNWLIFHTFWLVTSKSMRLQIRIQLSLSCGSYLSVWCRFIRIRNTAINYQFFFSQLVQLVCCSSACPAYQPNAHNPFETAESFEEDVSSWSSPLTDQVPLSHFWLLSIICLPLSVGYGLKSESGITDTFVHCNVKM